ncbi:MULTISPECIES: 4'-phosphopantetheinyl transferase family protein [unclassified Streptomyces]|uniref:4'-phosphopantetheinyl transferase family protein n=1 Tax=unclassified Streptomyces TaxID=2593676 RepID=UPI003801269B
MRPATGRLPPDGLDVWWMAVPPRQDAEADRRTTEWAQALLDPLQTQRAARLRQPERRHRFISAHAGLRLLLSHYLGAAPARVALHRAACGHCGGAHGKPYAEDGALHFSMSHSGQGVLYAFAPRPVGIDLETAPLRAGAEDRLAGYLHPEEQTDLAALPPGERASAFLRCWVRKEAYLKGIGVGIAHGVDGVRVGLGARPGRPGAVSEGDGGWRLVDVNVPTGFVAAAAYPGDRPRLRGRVLPLIRALA